MNDRFAERMTDPKVVHDVRTLADFIAIWCNDHHADRVRSISPTRAAELGAYDRRLPMLCAECAAHLAYGERRRAYCPKDPKPFCAHCDIHCYSPEEAEWQRQMMRYSGPRSMTRGHFIDGLKHMAQARRHRKQAARDVANERSDS